MTVRKRCEHYTPSETERIAPFVNIYLQYIRVQVSFRYFCSVGNLWRCPANLVPISQLMDDGGDTPTTIVLIGYRTYRKFFPTTTNNRKTGILCFPSRCWVGVNRPVISLMKSMNQTLHENRQQSHSLLFFLVGQKKTLQH